MNVKLLFRDRQALRREREISGESSERWRFALNLSGALGDAAGLYGSLLVFAGIALYVLNLISPAFAFIGAIALGILLAIVGVLFAVILVKDCALVRRGVLPVDDVAHGVVAVSTSGLMIWLITDLLLSAL